MQVIINDTKCELQGSESAMMLSCVLQSYHAKPPYAVALNGDFVPQEAWSQTLVTAGDCIDVVSPIFGG